MIKIEKVANGYTINKQLEAYELGINIGSFSQEIYIAKDIEEVGSMVKELLKGEDN